MFKTAYILHALVATCVHFLASVWHKQQIFSPHQGGSSFPLSGFLPAFKDFYPHYFIFFFD